ncbi:hypothetical protein [Pseudomonas sp. NPDC089741]|uniref:hypothetical protein n=1 Tax=Pseudomonas sp. NPDC089741 TaxID=3364470 RepID=UPI003809D65B
MNASSHAFAGFTGVCLILILLAAYAANEKYVCMGMQRGQIATVSASSVEEAVQIAKASWNAAGCYRE